PAAAGEVGGKGELRNGEHAAADVLEREVHLPGRVLEDAQAGDLARRFLRALPRIPLLGAEEDEQAPADPADGLSFDPDHRARYALDDELHVERETRAAQRTAASQSRTEGGRLVLRSEPLLRRAGREAVQDITGASGRPGVAPPVRELRRRAPRASRRHRRPESRRPEARPPANPGTGRGAGHAAPSRAGRPWPRPRPPHVRSNRRSPARA